MVAASRRLYLIIEAVAYPRYCEDKAWSLGEGFDLLTQLCYVDVETMGSGMCLASPDLFQQHLPCEYFASVEDENFEQIVFGGGQCNLLPLQEDASTCEVDEERPRLKLRLCATRCLGNVSQS